MLIKRICSNATLALAVLVSLSWANTIQAALPDDVNAALSSGTQAQKEGAIKALAVAHATNLANFDQLVRLVAEGSKEQPGAYAGALGGACAVSSDNAAITRIIISVFVEAYQEFSSAITQAVIAAGCPAEVAAATLQEALVTAAGGSLSLIPVLPNGNPGTGVNLLQQAFPKSLNTTRLGNVLEGLQQTVQETPMSPTQPNIE